MEKPRGGRATMRDVAAAAGVSIKTVSNVVTGTVPVRPGTRERVEAAMAELDFVPNLSARGLRNGRTGMIALALPHLDTPFSAELTQKLVEAAHRRGLAVQIEETGAAPEREHELLSRARAHLVDGLILNPVRLEDSILAESHHLPPAVLLGEVEDRQVDRVAIDSVAAARDLAAHVIAQGAKRIAVIGGDTRGTDSTATARLRLRGVHEALTSAGIAPDPQLEIGTNDWTLQGGADATQQLLDRTTDFDAALCFTDLLAMGALHALRQHGIRVPEDVLVTGFDDVTLARFTHPTLTTAAINIDELATKAIDMLVAKIANRSTAPHWEQISYEIVTRESTAAIPAGYRPAAS